LLGIGQCVPSDLPLPARRLRGAQTARAAAETAQGGLRAQRMPRWPDRAHPLIAPSETLKVT
jgi:hypothetical protein